MIVIFDDYIQYFYLVPVSTFIISTLIIAFNYWDSTQLEKNLMTNFKRIRIFLAEIFAGAIALSMLFSLIVFIDKDIKNITLMEDTITAYIMFAIVLFLIGLTYATIINFIVIFINKVLSPRFYYQIKLDENKVWDIVRLSNNNQLLLTNNDEYIFYNEWTNKVFIRKEYPKTKIQKYIYNGKIDAELWVFIFLALTFVILSVIVFCNEKLNSEISFVMTICVVVLIGLATGIYFNKKYYRQ